MHNVREVQTLDSAVTELWLEMFFCVCSSVLFELLRCEANAANFFAGGFVSVDKHLFKMASLASSMTGFRTNLYISLLLLATIDVLPKETKTCLQREAKPQPWQKY